MAISCKELEIIIRETFPNAKIKIDDIAGDEDHYSLEIEDDSFIGKSLINQHKLVNAALSNILHTKLHSITIKTKARQTRK